MKKDKFFVKKLAVCAIMLALATILSIFPTIKAPYGGSITIGSMLPIMMVSMLLGWRWGIPVAIGYSVIQLALDISAVASYGLDLWVFISCLMIDYILAFAILPVSNIFGTKTMSKMTCGITLAGILRYLCHFFSGWLFFGKWAEEGFNAFTWSVVYNGAYMIPDTVICVIIACSLYRMFPTFRKQLGIQ